MHLFFRHHRLGTPGTAEENCCLRNAQFAILCKGSIVNYVPGGGGGGGVVFKKV